MKEIQIEFLSVLADYIGIKIMFLEIDENGTIKELFDELAKNLGKKFVKYIYNPKENQINDNSLIILNNKDINSLNGLETEIDNGDKIIFIPAIAGG